MKQVLLTVSGIIEDDIAEQIANRQRPMADYLYMADSFDADMIDYAEARRRAGPFGRLLDRCGGPNLLLAWICFLLRGQYTLIFSDGEQVGIPLAVLLKLFGWSGKRPAHMMIVHILSVGKKKIFFDMLGIQSHIDTFFTYSTWQKEYIEKRWQVASERVVWTPFMVDDSFFAPSALVEDIRPQLALNYPGLPLICAVGLEFRDYPTLLEAVDGLDVQVVIAAASPWSKRDNTASGQPLPDNVLVQRFTQYELRSLYAYCDFVVMPLYHVKFQAGITAILEAMSMAKAIICTSTPGQTDVIVHDESGYYVPPEDPKTLRHAINYLLSQPAEAQRMGQLARARIISEMSLARYVERLTAYVTQCTRPTHTLPLSAKLSAQQNVVRE